MIAGTDNDLSLANAYYYGPTPPDDGLRGTLERMQCALRKSSGGGGGAPGQDGSDAPCGLERVLQV